MNIPIDVVVELLMSNYAFSNGQCDHPYWIRMDCNGWRIVEADSRDELRSKVSEYLLTLVPKPVMLSECEEGKPYWVDRSEIVVREGCGAYRWTDRKPLGFADQVQVIQPVEVK